MASASKSAARRVAEVDPRIEAVKNLIRPTPEVGMMSKQFSGLFMEGRLFQRLKDQRHIVRSMEAAACDGAVIISGPEQPEENETDRLFQVLRWSQTNRDFRLVLFDCKSSAIRQGSHTAAETSKVMDYWVIVAGLKETQNPICTFILHVLRERKNHVALLTRELIMKKQDVGKNIIRRRTTWIPRQMLAFVDYDPDTIPFTFHIDELPAVLLNLKQQLSQGQRLNVNGMPLYSNGQIFKSAKYLSSGSMRGDAAVTQWFHSAMKNNPQVGLQLRLLDFRPLWADFWIHLPSGKRVLIELKGTKDACFYQVSSGFFWHISRHAGTARSFFHSARPWDFLLTYNKADNECYCIPFDQIPSQWRDDRFLRPEDRPGNVWVKVPAADFALFRLRFSDSQWLAKLRTILETYQRSPPNEYDVSNLYKMSEPVADEAADIEGEVGAEGTEDDDEEEANTDAEARVEDTIAQQFRGEFISRILTDCAASGQGMCFWLGKKHPIADFVFFDYTWTKEEQDAYFSAYKLPIHPADLPDSACVILLTVNHDPYMQGQLQWISPRTRHLWRFFRDTPFIAIIATLRTSRTPEQDGTVMFLPSEELVPPSDWPQQKLQSIKGHFNRWWRGGKDAEYISLKTQQGLPMMHGMPISRVHEKLMGMICEEGNIRIGVLPMQSYAVERYVLTWREVRMRHAQGIYDRLNKHPDPKK